MATVTLVLEAQEAQAVNAYRRFIGTQKQAEAGFRAMGEAGNAMERKVVSGIQRMDSAMRRNLREFETRRRTQEQREASYVAPARFLGADVSDAGSVAFARWQMAQQIRARRAAEQAAAGSAAVGNWNLGRMNATLAAGQAGLDAAASRRQLQADTDLELFGARMDADRARKQKFRDQRQKIAQGALAVGAAVTMVAREAEQQLNEMADTVVRTEDMLTPLYGVGDNMTRRRQLREGVFTTAIGQGIDPQLIATLQFQRQSAASDLTPEVARAIDETAIKMYKLQGSNLNSTAMAMVGGLQILKGELAPGVEGVRELENKLAKAADVGAFEIDTVTPYLSMVLAAFQSMGFRNEDAFASMAMASKLGMRPEAYMTGLRNLPLVMSHAEKKLGQQMTGSFGEQMGQVAALESPELLQLVGRDPFVFAKYLSQNTDQLKQMTGQLKETGGKEDFVGQKLTQAYMDPHHVAAETIKTAKQLQAAGPAAVSTDYLDTLTTWELRKAGTAEMHPMLSWTAMPKVWLETLIADEEAGNPGQALTIGVIRAAAEARKAGNETKAGAIELRYGRASDSYWMKDGFRQYAGKQEADEFLKLRQTYTDLTAGEYIQLQQFRSNNPREASKYLERVGRPKGDAADKSLTADWAYRSDGVGGRVYVGRTQEEEFANRMADVTEKDVQARLTREKNDKLAEQQATTAEVQRSAAEKTEKAMGLLIDHLTHQPGRQPYQPGAVDAWGN